MRNLFFWQRWPNPERPLFNLAVLMFLLAMAGMGYYFSITPEPVIGFRTFVETELAELPFQTFRAGIFDLIIPANHYTVTERMLGTPLQPNLFASNLWLACFAIAVTGLLAVVTTASRYYYLAAMGVFILIVVSLKLETLLVFGRDDRMFSIFVLLSYGLCSFYIYYYVPGLKLGHRFLYLTAVTVMVAAIILLFSDAQNPSLTLATYSYPVAMIACVVFTVTVSHEIVASFIAILTRTGRSGKTLNHFLIITLIYLVNLVLAYSLEFGFLEWNIITINLYLLLAVSGVLGLWGLRQRQKQMEGIIDLEPHGLLGYVFIGSMAFGATAWFFATANDPAYDAVADIVIFSHLGYGFIFLLYVISNFGSMLSKNMAVHKVLYSPTNMPFFTFRLAGLIATIALLIYNTWQVPAHNAVAGYQNLVADLYLEQENTRVAAVYYDQGRTYGYSNHHSNYALANLAGLKFDHEGEKAFYKAASYLRPTEMSYLNWAQMLQSEDNPGGAIVILEEGIRRFPGSEPLSNTLGLLYASQGNPDSASIVLSGKDKQFVRSNLLALAARKKLPLLADTVENPGATAAWMANKLAFASSMGIISQTPLSLPADTSISVAQAAYLNNYLSSHHGKVDSAMLSQIESLARSPANAGLSEALLFSCALSWYSNGEVTKALAVMEEVAITSSSKGKYNTILALWCLEQHDPLRAEGFTGYALSQGYIGAYYTHAVTLTEKLRIQPGDIRPAIEAWDSLRLATDSSLVELARRTINILEASTSTVGSLEPADRYAFVRYRVAPMDTSTSVRILTSIEDTNLRARGLLELSQALLARDQQAQSVAILSKAMAIPITDAFLQAELRLHDRILAAVSGKIDELQAAGQSPLSITGNKTPYQAYFDGLVAEAAGDTVRAARAFNRVINSSFFFDEGLLAASRFFQTHGTDALKSYKLLADAIQYHPSSIRLRKAYIREAHRIGFDDFADHAMEELRQMIPEEEYRRFVAEIK